MAPLPMGETVAAPGPRMGGDTFTVPVGTGTLNDTAATGDAAAPGAVDMDAAAPGRAVGLWAAVAAAAAVLLAA